ncbi:hypothetical protein [Qipengyuania nanhaisediminis]|uniref:hypothetical protein n=1 Tax=Qipengyuania nanhaisediminis TaxID=604088 RepID=UPI0038B25133
MARINAAFARIETARAHHGASSSTTANDQAGSARVTALVNAHEKLREEVADTIGEIDALIEELEA